LNVAVVESAGNPKYLSLEMPEFVKKVQLDIMNLKIK